MPPVTQTTSWCNRRAPAGESKLSPVAWYRHEPYYYPVLDLPLAPGCESRYCSPFAYGAALLPAPLEPGSDAVLWFMRGAAEIFRGDLAGLAPACGETAVLSDISGGKVRGTWEFQPALRPVALLAAHTARCAEAFKRRPTRVDREVLRLFAGGMRSQKALQHFYLGVLAALSGAELLDVECTKNSVRFSVVGAEDAERVLELSKRLRCVGDSVVFSLRGDVDLNLMHVDHPTMLAGHATPIELSVRV